MRSLNRSIALICLVVVPDCQQQETSTAVGTLERHRIGLRAGRLEPILTLAVLEGGRVEAGDLVAPAEIWPLAGFFIVTLMSSMRRFKKRLD